MSDGNSYGAVSKAIQSLLPGAQFTLQNGDLNTLNWMDARPQPTVAQINAQISANATAQSNEDARMAAFDSDAGVIDLITRADTSTVAQIDSWLTANVTNLTQARTVLAAVIKLLALMYNGRK